MKAHDDMFDRYRIHVARADATAIAELECELCFDPVTHTATMRDHFQRDDSTKLDANPLIRVGLCKVCAENTVLNTSFDRMLARRLFERRIEEIEEEAPSIQGYANPEFRGFA